MEKLKPTAVNMKQLHNSNGYNIFSKTNRY